MTIIIRTKNRPHLLREAIASVLDQSWTNLEVIVVNDGGADVAAVLATFPADGRLRLIQFPSGRGRCAAGNAGLAAATGAAVMLLDDDDLLYPHAVSILAPLLSDTVVPYGAIDVQKVQSPLAEQRFVPARRLGREFNRTALLLENFIPIHACLAPTSLVRAAGGFDERLDAFEDWDLWLRLSAVAAFRFVPRPVGVYRLYGTAHIQGAGSRARREQHLARFLAVQRETYTPQRLRELRQWIPTCPSGEREHLLSRLEEIECLAGCATLDPPAVADRPVSVIIVTFNGRHHLETCLPALAATTAGRPVEVIVVDNGSSDGTADWLASTHPSVRVIALGSNLGFGRANHIGILHATHDTVALLNNDTIPEPGWIEALLRPIVRSSEIAASCAVLELVDPAATLNACGGGMTWLGFGFDHQFGQPSLAAERWPGERDCLFATAAAMVMRKADYLDVGGFDRAMFMYHEDVDLGWRFWLAGKRVVVCLDATVRHAFGASSPARHGGKFRAGMGARHAFRSLAKNLSAPLVFPALRHLLWFWLRQHAFSRVAGILMWNLIHLPGTLVQRARTQRRRTRIDRELIRRGLITAVGVPPPRPRFPIAGLSESNVPSSVLRPGESSSLAALGHGWGRNGKIERTSFRLVFERANAVVHGDPGQAAQVRVTARLVAGAGCKADVRFACGEAQTVVPLATDAWTTVTLQSCAGPDGLIPFSVEMPDWTHLDRPPGPPSPPPACAVAEVRVLTTAHAPAGRPASVSVVIPTINRWPRLERTLASLLPQMAEHDEVFVVDNGSGDGTPARCARWLSEHPSPARVTILDQPRRGAGAARNLAVEQARSELIVFLGDDTVPDEGFIAAHRAAHHAGGENVAVVGLTEWDADSLRVTPFLRFAETDGAQFAFAHFMAGEEMPFTCFYSSNVTIRRAALGQDRFDERFESYGWEDTELGFRLNLRGVRLLYDPAARCRHDHPTTLGAFMARQRQVGRAARLLVTIQPALADSDWLLPPQPPRRARLSLRVFRCLQPMIGLLDRLGCPLPRRVYREMLMAEYYDGLRDADRES